ncbi:hypothetical protein AC062_0174 [Pasteurellaceae bacterium NI1060]|nr:hypothetical protein AC062_0174 [Pasteurellaceae bacterium NI1060]
MLKGATSDIYIALKKVGFSIKIESKLLMIMTGSREVHA